MLADQAIDKRALLSDAAAAAVLAATPAARAQTAAGAAAADQVYMGNADSNTLSVMAGERGENAGDYGRAPQMATEVERIG